MKKDVYLQVQLPVQFEDFYVLSFGEISASPSYYGVDYIWPIGYRSCWHEKVTASLYTCEVSDDGDGGPVFTVRRCSCSTCPTPRGSTVLCREDKNDVFVDCTDTDYDEYDKVLKMLPDIIPPSQMDLGGSCDEECPAMGTLSLVRDEAGDDPVSRDFIGEIVVQGSSPSSAWKLLLEKVAAAYRKNVKRSGGLPCFCEHVDGLDFLSSMPFVCPSSSRDQAAVLGKFGSQHHVTGPSFIWGEKESRVFSESLMKWLRYYRFGLDVGFVQEIIERLPGAAACSWYTLCKERITESSLSFVNKKIRIKDGIEGVKDTEGDAGLTTLTISSKKESMLILGETTVNKQPFPSGSIISSRLSSNAVGNLVQVCMLIDILKKVDTFDCGGLSSIQVHEFLCRFQENLGLEDLLSFEELEKELLCPEEVVREKIHDSGSTVATYGLGESSILETIEINFTRCMGDKLTTINQALLPKLVSELLDKIASAVNRTIDKMDTTNWNMAKRIKLDMLPINQLTWPEVVRRYLLAYLLMGGKPKFLDNSIRNNTKLIRCLQGDGGICCCSHTGVAGVDVDAQLLGRAVNKVFNKLSVESYAKTVGLTETKVGNSDKNVLETGDSSTPDWAKVLDPVRKLPTNVGARIRNLIIEALQKNPPEWAKKRLKDSISKEVYKGNASGPTKVKFHPAVFYLLAYGHYFIRRAVIKVLTILADEAPTPSTPNREEKRTPDVISKLTLKECRIVLRHVAAYIAKRSLTDLVGRNLNNDGDDLRFVFGSTSIRPLDIRTIDWRLLHGSYGDSHEAFLEDVRELWINLKLIHSNKPDLVKSADKMSKEFETRYKNEVASQFERFHEYKVNGKFTKEVEKELEEELNSLEIPQVPWERGICKVCGLNRDDKIVLLCDMCNAEYHTYCLRPPLPEIPKGNWYCPACGPRERLVNSASQGPQKILRSVNEYLEEGGRFLDVATDLEGTEYWELGADKKTFLLKFLCDELLNTTLIRKDPDQSRSKLDNAGTTTNRELLNDNSFVPNDHLTEKLPRLSLRREFLGIDSDGRLYWGFPETSPRHGIVVNENPYESNPSDDHPENNHPQAEPSSSWRVFQSDDKIHDLVDYLRRNDPGRTELRDSILRWQESMVVKQVVNRRPIGIWSTPQQARRNLFLPIANLLRKQRLYSRRNTNRTSSVSGSNHDGSSTLVSTSDPFSGAGGNFVIPEGSLKPVVGMGLYVLRQLKMNLLDMEAALPDGGKRSSRAGPEWRSAWCRFVKSAKTIYEMVQAMMVFETMIKTEYINNTWWWHWSSASIAAKTSTISALALRIYTLDAAIDYQKTSISFTPKQSKKRKHETKNVKRSEDKNKKMRPVEEQKDGTLVS
ncbi:hypothetical protein OSB04_007720 [Centaurea solstitialis]|uniref:PHD-type domain-containing protein n=1 Tax=Centaurea solstitialis TaxID=347529 RepID=A0AA38TKE2_9ASTR|nr:hypothetical protein OSB04_007720 [Centaurea solstitialis]